MGPHGTGKVRGVLEGSEDSWKDPRGSGRVRGLLEGSEGSWKGPMDLGRVRGVLEGSKGFWKGPRGSGRVRGPLVLQTISKEDFQSKKSRSPPSSQSQVESSKSKFFKVKVRV